MQTLLAAIYATPSSVVDRLKAGLGRPCLPEPLPAQAACTLLAALPEAGSCEERGLATPDSALRDDYRNALRADVGDAAGNTTICLVPQLSGSDLVGGTCEAGPGPERGWTVTAVLPRA